MELAKKTEPAGSRKDGKPEIVKRLGLMGGTFDPIHQGHLVLAEAARCTFQLDQVVFIPSGHPPHKRDHAVTSGPDRCRMTELAIAANPYFALSRVEVEREGYSYAIDTVRYFLKGLPKGGQLFFITGADAILDVLTWKDAEQLFEACTFLAAARPGFGGEGFWEQLAKRLSPAQLAKVEVLEAPALDISSTEIRRRLAEGRSVRYLLPDAVAKYIYENGLYEAGGKKLP